MNPSYIATNLEDLYAQTIPAITDILESGETDTETKTIAGKYKLPLSSVIPLSNIISFILIGALQPADVVRAITEIVVVPPETAKLIAEDLEKGILAKARALVMGKEPVAKLAFKADDGGTAELRKKIMDTTKRESGLAKDQSGPPVPGQKQAVITPGSRNQLLEQLQVLGTIPNDEEVEGRLKHIQEQLASIQAKEAIAEPDVVKVPAKVYNFGEKGGELVEAIKQVASYSTAPTRYNVDPYREVADN